MTEVSDDVWEGASLETKVVILRLQQLNHEKVCAARWMIALRLLWAILALVAAYAAWSSKALYDNNEEQLRELRLLQQSHAAAPRTP